MPGTGHPSLWVLAVAALAPLAAAAPARAGGPIALTAAGQPKRWNPAQPVPYVVSGGPFGSRSHAGAVQMAAQAFHVWESVPTARIRFQKVGEIDRAIDGSNVMALLNGVGPNDPGLVLLDSDGTVLDTLLGDGVSKAVWGFGRPLLSDPASGRIAVSMAILNGRLLSGYTDSFTIGAFVHELGHFAGLAHSQLNSEALLDGDPTNDGVMPQMFYRGPNKLPDLQLDDRAWLSWLYPAADFPSSTGTIRGRVLLPDGQQTGIQGIHVIARRVGDPQVTSVSGVSGFLFRNVTGGVHDPARLGEFMIPGLPPGSFTLEVQALQSFPAVPPLAAYLVGGPKLWREGSSGHDPPTTSSPIMVRAGQTVTGIDIVLNGDSLGEPKPVAAQPPNRLPNPQKVPLPALITGQITGGSLSGPLVRSIDDLQDAYEVTLREPTLVTAILATADQSADMDLYVLQPSGSRWLIEGLSREAGTPPEVVQLRLPAGRHAFVLHQAGDRAAVYTLRLLATPAPDPAKKPEAAVISYLAVGDVTATSAVARWLTTIDSAATVYYNRPQQEAGATKPQRVHVVPLPALAAGISTRVEVYSQSPAGPDVLATTVTPSVSPTPGGAPRIVAQSSARSLAGFPDLAQVEVRLANAGDGDARNVRIEQVELPPGWEDAVEALSAWRCRSRCCWARSARAAPGRSPCGPSAAPAAPPPASRSTAATPTLRVPSSGSSRPRHRSRSRNAGERWFSRTRTRTRTRTKPMGARSSAPVEGCDPAPCLSYSFSFSFSSVSLRGREGGRRREHSQSPRWPPQPAPLPAGNGTDENENENENE